MTTRILGISAYYHDAAAALCVDGRIVAAAQEERFSRKKNDASFPTEAVRACLAQAEIEVEDLDHVVFYEKPLLKFDRILETHLSRAPRTFPQFRRALPTWLGQKLFLPRELRKCLGGRYKKPFLFTDHHEAHAAAAFFPSPFEEAAILTIDGVGEWSTTTLGFGRKNELRLSRELRFPHSLGLLYTAFTQWAGFEPNTGEYMLMGLAPYGEPRYESLIRERMVDIKPDGSFRLDLRYFDFLGGLTMISPAFEALFGAKARAPGAPIEKVHEDVAASIQRVTEEILLRLARTVAEETGAHALCMGGGCALNSVAVGRIRREGPFERIWVQPAAGDAGSALGAALFAWHDFLDKPRDPRPDDALSGALLGPSHEIAEVRGAIEASGLVARELEEPELLSRTAEALDAGRVLGFFQGRMEFGPRALGGRSILADPRVAEMKDTINHKIKHREGFRPFAPAALKGHAHEHFEVEPGEDLPYMTHVVPVRAASAKMLPAVTHVDGSARLQTVDEARHGLYFRVLEAFHARTGCPVLLDTSFNVRGEPIVCRPLDALRCFAKTDLDGLVIERFLLLREEQPEEALAKLAAEPPPAENGLFSGGIASGAFRLWIGLGEALGVVTRPIFLGVVYLAIFTPVALARALFGADPLSLRFDPSAQSYFSDKRISRAATLRDLLGYLRETRKLWLTPVIVILLVLGVVISLSGTALSPLIYTLF